MIDIVSDRSARKSASLDFLKAHIRYLSDPTHEDHADVEFGPPKIFNLANATTDRFLKAVTDAGEAYIKYRTGRRGKRTASIWDECIYRTPDDTDLNDEEKSMVELTMLSIRPGVPAFTQWHYKKSRASWDLHVLTPTKSADWPPHVTLSASYGAGKKHIFAELDRLDQDLVDSLNMHRPPGKTIESKIEAKKRKALAAIGKKESLAKELARIAKGAVSRDNLVALITKAGHKVPRPPKTDSAKFVTVHYKGRKQGRRENIDELLLDISDIQKPAPTKSTPGPEMTSP